MCHLVAPIFLFLFCIWISSWCCTCYDNELKNNTPSTLIHADSVFAWFFLLIHTHTERALIHSFLVLKNSPRFFATPLQSDDFMLAQLLLFLAALFVTTCDVNINTNQDAACCCYCRCTVALAFNSKMCANFHESFIIRLSYFAIHFNLWESSFLYNVLWLPVNRMHLSFGIYTTNLVVFIHLTIHLH